MSARKSLALIALVSAPFSVIAFAQAQDAGTEAVLYQNNAAFHSRIWAESEYAYQKTLDDAGIQEISYVTEVADDFVVPAGEVWSIQRLFLEAAGEVGEPYDPSLNVSVWTDNAGLPGARVAGCSLTDAEPEIISSEDLSVAFAQPCTLQPGHYWLAVTGDNPGAGFLYIDVSLRLNAPASDSVIAVRSGCGYPIDAPPATLPNDWQHIRNECVPFNEGQPTFYPQYALKFGLFGSVGVAPADAGTPLEDGGLEDAGGEQTDAGGGLPDAGTADPDAGPGETDAGMDAGGGDGGPADGSSDGDPADGDPGDGASDGDPADGAADGDDADGQPGDGASDGDDEDGDDEDGDDGDVDAGTMGGGSSGGGGGCSTHPAAGSGSLGLFYAGMFGLGLLRRRRKSRQD